MDKVGDLLIRLKNGYLAKKMEVEAPFSKLSVAIIELLTQEGFVKSFEINQRLIKITLKYEDKKAALSDVKRVSKPGRRVYCGSKAMPRVLNGLGVAVISTPKGIMTDRQARKESLGGEIMAFVW